MQAKTGKSLTECLKRAIGSHQTGHTPSVVRLHDAILGFKPEEFDHQQYEALHYLGVLEAQQGRLRQAYRLIAHALRINPQDAKAHSNLGNVLQGLQRREEALVAYETALAINPSDPRTRNNYGVALEELGRHEQALASYDQALALESAYAEAHNNRGNALLELSRPAEALASYDRALGLDRDSPDFHNNRGHALLALKRAAEALACHEQALALRPDSADFHNSRGNALQVLKRFEEAAASYQKALAIEPGHENALGTLVYSKRHCCDWSRHDEERRRVVSKVRSGESIVHPFAFLTISDSARDQLTCARQYANRTYPAAHVPVWKGERYRHDRIRIAYLSADFHEHATAYLMAGLFERHDRARFETTAVSFGPDEPSAMRSRLKEAFDRFIDVRQKSDREVANLLRGLEIDIAVDLKGYTTDERTGIFAQRPAPIQVNYLGFPGTTGTDFFEYILADRFVIPEDHRAYYTEKVVYLPDTYQVNDSSREIAEPGPSRAAVGLPENGLVLCSFNNSYKIAPAVFGAWIRLLHQVPGSVLWLLGDNADAIRNLQREASERGISRERLVFAPRVSQKNHLARHRLADISLDTLPCGAHTTASDALWAGVPVVTCAGTTFAGRVGAGLLNAIALPELVTHSLTEYETLALRLATEPDVLAALKAKLARNRGACPLFDTDRFRRHVEAAYLEMWERHQRGEPAAGFAVEAQA
jgi:protein O-GlcNAc transferase